MKERKKNRPYKNIFKMMCKLVCINGALIVTKIKTYYYYHNYNAYIIFLISRYIEKLD